MNHKPIQFKDISHPTVNRLLSELLLGLKSILKENLLSVYVYGSFVWGDFDEAISDIDTFVALNQEIAPQEFEALDNLHNELVENFPVWKDRIEVAYASYKMLQHFKTDIGKIAVISPGEPFNIKNAGTDWLINYYLLQNKSIILYGPKPKSIIAPVSNNEFVEHVKKQAIEWQEWVVHTKKSLGYQYYAVLTLCRAMYVIHHHEQGSKLKAGTWVTTQFPKWQDLIQRALIKVGPSDANNDCIEETYQEVTAFVNEMVQHIQEGE
ncbi:TPA: aminoglycoside adenylyltransferase domain-containing protein [Legionella pneumophila]